jgi:hypothetical protein
LHDAERVVAFPDQLAAGAQESDAGFECRDIVLPIGAQMAPQLTESLAYRGLEFGEADTRALRRDLRQCLAGGATKRRCAASGVVGATMAHSTMAIVAATTAAVAVLMRPTGS